MTINHAAIEELDRTDPLAGFRDRFAIPEGIIYLDGNSLGVLPRGVEENVSRIIREEWGRGLISSWAGAGWIDLPETAGAAIARLVGAEAGEVVVGDSTSVNLFKCLAAALALRPGRRVILTEDDNFPTDNYIAQGLGGLIGGYDIRYVPPGGDPLEMIDDTVAVVTLTHVNYRTAAVHDMAAVTRAAHAAGALVVWDLSHSTGALKVDLGTAQADFAVGCTYKYLNGGPGAPAFTYAASRLLPDVSQPLSGWMGHREPFAFVRDYAPAEAARRFVCGTPQILSLGALVASLDIWNKVDMTLVREKSLQLTTLFMDLVERHLGGHGLTIVTPREAARRGSHVSIAADNGYPIMRALAERGVVGDFRAPNLMRFGFTPLYTSFTDVAAAVGILHDVLEQGAWRDERYSRRLKVT